MSSFTHGMIFVPRLWNQKRMDILTRSCRFYYYEEESIIIVIAAIFDICFPSKKSDGNGGFCQHGHD